MPRSRSKPALESCRHSILTSSLSPHAESTGYRPYTNQQVLNAITGRRKHPPDAISRLQLDAFPAPLVLPGDAIDLDPKYPPQSFRSWLNESMRNQVTSRQNIVYIAAPPEIDRSVKFMEAWSRPNMKPSTVPKRYAESRHLMANEQQAAISCDKNVPDIINYLKAFYHGLKVKPLPTPLKFKSWDDSPNRNSKSKARKGIRTKSDAQAVALSTDTEAVRIQVRRTPPSSTDSPEHVYPYSHQLNLNDMTDVALSVLPPDAYALVLLTEHDMYESEDDDFCCGRAWGASRVAIVSSARYQPCLDRMHGVDRDHVWPTSHCADFLESMSSVENVTEPYERRQSTKRRRIDEAAQGQSPLDSSPLARAFESHNCVVASGQLSAVGLNSMFLFRLCRTVSHELGHCFGLDHCMYKACVMQGTASVAEDMRQPPYLCPVCEAKIAWAVVGGHTAESEAVGGSESAKAKRKKARHAGAQSDGEELDHLLANWKRERHVAMKRFCEQYDDAFASLLAWSTAFLDASQSE
ncbi:hypothetical protein H2200_006031 [Cladophialophora chaetospira]|uniref:Uncharacterized protein n=1 Tax=Cladophialophora chaetospira TaxID=386627 RepID=A0AA39CI62_9EURO|nr:hypothetical protein H2200_006031 [Cladophialophora chaetospira]